MEGEAGGMIAYPAGHAEGFADAVKQAFHDFYGHYANGEGSYAHFRDGLRSMRLCEAA